jgi:hypothetical protein
MSSTTDALNACQARNDSGSLSSIFTGLVTLAIGCTWTMECEASQYRETLALEQAMRSNADVRRRWMEEQATVSFDAEELEDAEQEFEEAEA